MAPKPPNPRPVPRGNLPVSGKAKPVQMPHAGPVGAPTRWTFSFRYWKQLPWFGLDRLGDVSDKWFVSLLERLHELSTQRVDDVLDSLGAGAAGAAGALRFHKIEHDHEHVTMKREAFDWIAPEYLASEDEYPICQVHISKSLGRVVGFFDEHNVFNVLLLDPNHNLWLSNYADYKVRACAPLDSHYATLRVHLDKVLGHLDGRDDQVERARAALLKAIADRTAPDGVTRIVVSLDSGYEKGLVELLATKRGTTLRAVMEQGVLVLSEQPADPVPTTDYGARLRSEIE